VILDADQKEKFFERVLKLAQGGWGRTHPNPMVGSLIVERGEIVAEGYHQACGGSHAEIETFATLGREPGPDAVMFVSLEPCSTHGETPPCTGAILRSGIKKVFVACIDPNPKHAGRGIEILVNAGVEVEMAPDLVRDKAERMNFIFNHNMRTGGPLIALKLAESANGMVTERSGHPSSVTGAEARQDVMRWRRFFPAICVGSGTVLADDPSLTARLPDETWCPVRILVDSSLSTLRDGVAPRKVHVDEFSDRTVILTTAKGMGNIQRVARAKESGTRLIEVEEAKGGGIDPAGLRVALSELCLNALYCEGGPTFARSLLEADQVDYLFHYRSPKIFEGPDALPGPGLDGYPVREPIEEEFGEDRLVHGFL
jgi:diaminohydroxyphosphoribosylaminopyrimidine deaminase / 5-amino-6-(5-phosphoribosylamino)uracil reductase